MRTSSHAQRRGINMKWQMANKMWQSFCAPPRRSCLSLAALLLLITVEICPVLASTKIRLGTNNDFLFRVHEDDLARPAVPWRQAISLLLDRVKQQGPSNHARSRKGSLSLRQNDGDSNIMQSFNDAAQASVLRQMEEERRTARPDREPVSNKQIAGQDGSAKDTSKGVGSKRNRRSIMSFNDVIIWGWKGVYHQCKEIERVLAPHYRVRLTLHEYMFPHTDPADDGALYILMTPHLCVDLPPHYIIWQTEQWGHHMLQVGNRRWANQRNEPNLLDFVEVFEGAVEVWDYSLVHLKNFEPIFKGKDVKFRHVPFSWFPLDPPITKGEKDIDVLFYGWIVDGSRRNKMLDELRFERNVSIHVSNMDAYREDLTKLLRRAKVILNIHAYPAKVLEICRILEAISFDIVVITEPGVEAALDAQWKDKLVFVDGMDQIVQQIEVYRSNSTLRNQVLKAATAHAKAHYSLETYLAEFLQHRRM